MDIDAVESRIAELERRISTVAEVSAREKLYVGVDLGTAYIVVVVVNSKGEPVACALEFAQVVSPTINAPPEVSAISLPTKSQF